MWGLEVKTFGFWVSVSAIGTLRWEWFFSFLAKAPSSHNTQHHGCEHHELLFAFRDERIPINRANATTRWIDPPRPPRPREHRRRFVYVDVGT